MTENPFARISGCKRLILPSSSSLRCDYKDLFCNDCGIKIQEQDKYRAWVLEFIKQYEIENGCCLECGLAFHLEKAIAGDSEKEATGR